MVICKSYLLQKRGEEREEFRGGKIVDVEWLKRVGWECRGGGSRL
jgi:hypothetical protein